MVFFLILKKKTATLLITQVKYVKIIQHLEQILFLWKLLMIKISPILSNFIFLINILEINAIFSVILKIDTN